MLTAYLSIIQGIPYIALILAGVVCFSLIFQDCSSIARSILFSFGFWLAPLFYLTYIVLVHRAPLKILAALFVEGIILIIYHALFSSLFSIVSNRELVDHRRLMRWLKFGTAIVVALALPLFFVGNFGIFSDGSRNEYLADSRWFMYSAYASILIQAVMVPIVAAILNYEKRWNKFVVLYLIIVSVLSLLAGSKGGGIMSIFAILSLLKFREAKEYIRLLRFPLIASVTVFISSIYYLGRFLALDPLQMTSLMFVRIFMNNDARALAIDIGGSQNLSLFRESFRSLATLLGSPPVNPALGQYLYAQAFNTSGFVGANTSSTALLIAYGGPFEKAMFSVLLCTIAIFVYLLTCVRGRGRHSILRLAIGIELLSLLSQDFLAFQLIGNLLVLAGSLTIVGWLVYRLLLVASNSVLAL